VDWSSTWRRRGTDQGTRWTEGRRIGEKNHRAPRVIALQQEGPADRRLQPWQHFQSPAETLVGQRSAVTLAALEREKLAVHKKLRGRTGGFLQGRTLSRGLAATRPHAAPHDDKHDEP
jgi:hypothetical protein